MKQSTVALSVKRDKWTPGIRCASAAAVLNGSAPPSLNNALAAITDAAQRLTGWKPSFVPLPERPGPLRRLFGAERSDAQRRMAEARAWLIRVGLAAKESQVVANNFAWKPIAIGLGLLALVDNLWLRQLNVGALLLGKLSRPTDLASSKRIVAGVDPPAVPNTNVGNGHKFARDHSEFMVEWMVAVADQLRPQGTQQRCFFLGWDEKHAKYGPAVRGSNLPYQMKDNGRVQRRDKLPADTNVPVIIADGVWNLRNGGGLRRKNDWNALAGHIIIANSIVPVVVTGRTQWSVFAYDADGMYKEVTQDGTEYEHHVLDPNQFEFWLHKGGRHYKYEVVNRQSPYEPTQRLIVCTPVLVCSSAVLRCGAFNLLHRLSYGAGAGGPRWWKGPQRRKAKRGADLLVCIGTTFRKREEGGHELLSWTSSRRVNSPLGCGVIVPTDTMLAISEHEDVIGVEATTHTIGAISVQMGYKPTPDKTRRLANGLTKGDEHPKPVLVDAPPAEALAAVARVRFADPPKPAEPSATDETVTVPGFVATPTAPVVGAEASEAPAPVKGLQFQLSSNVPSVPARDPANIRALFDRAVAVHTANAKKWNDCSFGERVRLFAAARILARIRQADTDGRPEAPGPVSPWSIDQVIEHQQKPLQVLRNARYLEDDYDPDPALRINVMQKAQATAAPNPRAIQVQKDATSKPYSCFTLPAADFLKSLKAYGPGRTAAEYAAEVGKLISSAGDGPVCSFDVSDMDMSQGEVTYGAYEAFMYELFLQQNHYVVEQNYATNPTAAALRSALMNEAHVELRCRDIPDLSAPLSGVTSTGSPATTVKNCVHGLTVLGADFLEKVGFTDQAIADYAKAIVGARDEAHLFHWTVEGLILAEQAAGLIPYYVDPPFQVTGDDLIIIPTPGDAEGATIVAAYARYGMALKAEEVVEGAVPYLRRYWLPDGSSVGDPKHFAGKAGLLTTTGGAAAEQVLGLLCRDGATPFWATFANCLQRVYGIDTAAYGKAKAKWSDDYKMTRERGQFPVTKESAATIRCVIAGVLNQTPEWVVKTTKLMASIKTKEELLKLRWLDVPGPKGKFEITRCGAAATAADSADTSVNSRQEETGELNEAEATTTDGPHEIGKEGGQARQPAGQSKHQPKAKPSKEGQKRKKNGK